MAMRVPCEVVSWNRVHRLTRRLAWRIRDGGRRPEVIVAIARGGYVPARILCDYLYVTELTSIRIVHYTAGTHREKQARLAEPLSVDVRDRAVLIVDDVSDTGDTLRLSRDHVCQFEPRDVRIGVLHHKTVSAVAPDYFAARMTEWRWVVYPWAMIEDISGLLADATERPHTRDQAAARLAADFGIRVPVHVLDDVLKELDHGD
ncbi:MAG: phosphoribosyltransferase [Gammaproteobacteria bacterium]|nr:phosphoribosyltransferase [Gammaproteobacteria bacterium]NIR97331.1 phosphoribosyltransferase [Gammaproteobacteria bacterium]NIT63374.1 phosphoribosyltransferase [Gammaproteobacteria bacterium]NIV20301.1 phosphoribosyltransferase [Gammaproteobacteria bacterium]NIX10718.1 phosphoribosyltransferase [Gammaproteobacteria bacterium]